MLNGNLILHFKAQRNNNFSDLTVSGSVVNDCKEINNTAGGHVNIVERHLPSYREYLINTLYCHYIVLKINHRKRRTPGRGAALC